MSTTIHWAIKTKTPQDTKDYRVLAASGGLFSETEFSQMFNHAQVGNIPERLSEFDPQSPWFTFDPHVKGRDIYYIVTRHSWLQYTDYKGRSVGAVLCICIPFVDFAQSFSSMTAVSKVYEIVDYLCLRPALEQIAKGIVSFNYQPIEPDSIINQGTHFVDWDKHEFYLSVASMLLRNPVGLVTSGNVNKLSWQERVTILDTVLNLLPLGAKADCAVGTWTQSGVRHNMRLSFCSVPNENQQRIVMDQKISVELEKADDFAGEYYRSLRALIKYPNDLERVTKLLAKHTSPLRFSHPDAILNALYSLDGNTRWFQDTSSKIENGKKIPDVNRRELIQNWNSHDAEKQRIILGWLLDDLDSEHKIKPITQLSFNKEELYSQLITKVFNLFENAKSDDEEAKLGLLLILSAELGWAKNILSALCESAMPNVGQWRRFIHFVNKGMRQKTSKPLAAAITSWGRTQKFPVKFLFKWAELLAVDSTRDDYDFLTDILENQETGFAEINVLDCLQVAWSGTEVEITPEMISALTILDIPLSQLLLIRQKRGNLG